MNRNWVHRYDVKLTGLALLVLAFLLLELTVCRADDTEDWFAQIQQQAESLAATEYRPPEPLDPLLRDLDYDDWRNIRLRPEHVVWRAEKLPYELQFFHPGFVYDRTVTIRVIDDTGSQTLKAGRERFDYGGLATSPQIPLDVGFAGFRVHTAIKTPEYLDEFLVFLGGSYLRAVGQNHTYGLSARGLALDTAAPEGEEFPWFREFWVVKPKAPAVSKKTKGKGGKAAKKAAAKVEPLEIYALLDSPRVTGAYKFVAHPGDETVLDVSFRLFFRQPVTKVGIGPLTSMYFFGENDRSHGAQDFRPEVHDSDGLQIHFGTGEWLWRPLRNPRTLQVNSFKALGLKGFGLMQRDQDFRNYEDLEAHYQSRPSAWVEPMGDWGDGHVELVQIPTKEEIHDNVVAYWVPAVPPQAGDSWSYQYRLRWNRAEQVVPTGGRVVSTRVGYGNLENVRRFVIDFAGPLLDQLPDDAELTAVVDAGSGARVLESIVQRNPHTGGWRLVFELEYEAVSTLQQVLPEKTPPVELRAFLKQGPDVVTETWSYALARKDLL